MFDLIADKLPELQRLERVVATLEQERTEARGRHAQLVQEVAAVREDDLNREAAALNAGKRTPKPREPQLRSQLEGVERELEVLERRLALAQADRARFIQSNHERLAALLMEAQASEGERVAEGASQVLADLLRYFQAEDDMRALRRLVPAPAEENRGAAEQSVTVWGNLTTRNITGGPARGDLEATLRYLISLGETTVVGEDAEGTAYTTLPTDSCRECPSRKAGRVSSFPQQLPARYLHLPNGWSAGAGRRRRGGRGA